MVSSPAHGSSNAGGLLGAGKLLRGLVIRVCFLYAATDCQMFVHFRSIGLTGDSQAARSVAMYAVGGHMCALCPAPGAIAPWQRLGAYAYIIHRESYSLFLHLFPEKGGELLV